MAIYAFVAPQTLLVSGCVRFDNYNFRVNQDPTFVQGGAGCLFGIFTNLFVMFLFQQVVVAILAVRLVLASSEVMQCTRGRLIYIKRLFSV